MTDDIIEGEVVDQHPALVSQPGQSLVAKSTLSGPHEMLAQAREIANALTHMVESQKLYTLISGKKYPQVEAWMTIGRMDNVVAREAGKPIQNDDESWEAEVELVRLSDGMVIGRASAMCGAKGDRPWDSRPAHQRRSMAVTRATSRAFRQQYSWIMALAGYEPTPADEMPAQTEQTTPSGAWVRESSPEHDGLNGTAEVGKASTSDFQMRMGPDGAVLGFRLTQGRKGFNVITRDELAMQMLDFKDDIVDQRVTVWGRVVDETFTNKQGRDITYQIIHADRIQTPKGMLPVKPQRDPEQEVVDALPIAEGQEPLPL